MPEGLCPEFGRSYGEQGLPEKELQAHMRCLQDDPDNSDRRLQYALALESLRRDEEALKAFQSVLAVAPGYADAKEGLARLAARERAGTR